MFLGQTGPFNRPGKLRKTASLFLQRDLKQQDGIRLQFQQQYWQPLVANKVYPDPYYGTNIESVPGYTADRRAVVQENNPFRAAWWYRTEFSLPSAEKSSHHWLQFQSINYKANIWLNGQLIADTNIIEGAYRLYNLDITQYAISGKTNCLALEIFPPKGMDLTITWVDWNPTPPDHGMGIWYDVFVRSTGPVNIENPHVITKLNLPSVDQAKLTISV